MIVRCIVRQQVTDLQHFILFELLRIYNQGESHSQPINALSRKTHLRPLTHYRISNDCFKTAAGQLFCSVNHWDTMIEVRKGERNFGDDMLS